METYPLAPVVTAWQFLANEYNGNFLSNYMLSSCIDSQQFSDLVRNGAKFAKIIIVDDEGQSLLPLIGESFNWNEELMPTIIKYRIQSDDIHKAVLDIHTLIAGDPNQCGMG